MISNVVSIPVNEVISPCCFPSKPTEEELVHWQLVRDVMSRIDFNEVKSSMSQERGRFKEVFAAQLSGESKSSAFVPALDTITAKIENVLMELKATEQTGTLRMCQIESRLAEIRATRAKYAYDEGAYSRFIDYESPVVIDFSENARDAYLLNQA